MPNAVQELIERAVSQGATAIVLADGQPPRMLTGNTVVGPSGKETTALEGAAIEEFLRQLCRENTENFEEFGDERGCLGAPFGRVSFRRAATGRVVEIALRVPEERFTGLELPYGALMVERIKELSRGQSGGLFLIGGPVASGKTTALHQLLLKVAAKVPSYIVGLYRSLEYMAAPGQVGESLVSQEKIGAKLEAALANVGRAQIIFVDGLQSGEDCRAAIEAAIRGHIVVATKAGHTSTVSLIEAVAEEAGNNERTRELLSKVLKSAVVQKVLWNASAAVVACEVMIATPAIQNLIRENKSYRITSAIQTGHKHGMNMFDEHLVKLVRDGKISPDVARATANMPEEMDAALKSTETRE